MLLQNNLNPGKYSFAKPYDSASGMPFWVYIICAVFLLYILVKVWIALKNDKKGKNNLN
jgi:hypothetical protein